jgi:hypothetical protein
MKRDFFFSMNADVELQVVHLDRSKWALRAMGARGQQTTWIVENLLLEPGEGSFPANAYHWQTDDKSGIWVERIFTSKMKALAFFWRKMIAHGMVNHVCA